MPSSSLTVSQWLADVKEGDQVSMRELWNRYFQRLAKLAEQRVRHLQTRPFDGEDIAASVLKSLWDGAQLGQFENVQDRHELWWLLVWMAQRKAIDHVRRETADKRGGQRKHFPLGMQPGSSSDFEALLSKAPTAADLLAFDEHLGKVLEKLSDPKARKIAVLLLQGYSQAEISRELGVAVVTVRRKVQLIRQLWREVDGS